jgi:SAM-dependent methyltransferase
MATAAKSRFIQIDEEGYFKFGDTRVSDEDVGRQLFQQLRKDESNRFITEIDGVQAFIEAFDQPLVGLQVEPVVSLDPSAARNKASTSMILQMPYGHREKFDPHTLTLDEWDRFHGVTERGLPFVLSRPAQAAFFNMLDEFDDESITLSGEKIEADSFLPDMTEVEDENFWGTKYQESPTPGWDLQGPTPVLADILPQLKLPRSRILVVGAGRGHDAVYLAAQGHLVTALDVSPEAEKRFREAYPNEKNVTYLVEDIFSLPAKMHGAYDIVFEHTCFCAINPARRNELVKIWQRILSERGHLLGIFYIRPEREGPPFGASEWEIQQRLKKSFDFLYWTRWKNSAADRTGQELVVYAQRK